MKTTLCSTATTGTHFISFFIVFAFQREPEQQTRNTVQESIFLRFGALSSALMPCHCSSGGHFGAEFSFIYSFARDDDDGKWPNSDLIY